MTVTQLCLSDPMSDCVFVTPWTAACHAPLSMRFSRQEYWGGMPCPSSGDLTDPGIEPTYPLAPALQADSLPVGHQGTPTKYLPPHINYILWDKIAQ